MKNKILLVVFIILMPFIVVANYQFSGLILDSDTKTPIPSVKINIYTENVDTPVFSNNPGKFFVDNIQNSKVSMEFYRDN